MRWTLFLPPRLLSFSPPVSRSGRHTVERSSPGFLPLRLKESRRYSKLHDEPGFYLDIGRWEPVTLRLGPDARREALRGSAAR
ncbi:hypothetical protein EYF80_046766 [Liparis tanakae]|uniref:Uncharacterized protein n=1 Tax=Liparis tanakae TaxID=230148 RepID=A0A4Z2FPA5_9TELE|nr:hypothetical protein EYF80_046766 [Liparis tanakae]